MKKFLFLLFLLPTSAFAQFVEFAEPTYQIYDEVTVIWEDCPSATARIKYLAKSHPDLGVSEQFECSGQTSPYPLQWNGSRVDGIADDTRENIELVAMMVDEPNVECNTYNECLGLEVASGETLFILENTVVNSATTTVILASAGPEITIGIGFFLALMTMLIGVLIFRKK